VRPHDGWIPGPADVSTRWWRARTLAELAAMLDATGSCRRETLALCQMLDTDEARTLAVELVR
jgi:hypothetical protein